VVAIIVLCSIGVVAWQLGDELVMNVAIVAVGATAGFVVWNYPISKIFLGDGGAYLIGFIVAELLILLVERNPAVSPIYAALVSIYPVFETVFSIYRRRVLRGLPAGKPDAIHLHTLIYRRVVASDARTTDLRAMNLRNSRTSPYLWTLTLGACCVSDALHCVVCLALSGNSEVPDARLAQANRALIALRSFGSHVRSFRQALQRWRP
jgi:UDP-N-acetylmuramyl pentapeptide phosphotransferase/UDP-N-acetylglucosamine-1-phosphate transferase